jgi:hypothetical protein
MGSAQGNGAGAAHFEALAGTPVTASVLQAAKQSLWRLGLAEYGTGIAGHTKAARRTWRAQAHREFPQMHK